MAKALGKRGADVVVATPGRLMELIVEEKTDLQSRCTFLVVDEAGRGVRGGPFRSFSS